MRLIKHLPLLAALSFPLALLTGAVVTEGCSVSPAQVTAITQAGAQELECVATAALNSGITDPMVIATLCGGLTIQTIVNIIDVLFAGAAGTPVIADAGLPEGAASDAALVPLASAAIRPRLFVFTAAEHERLLTVRTRGATLLSSKSAK
jgi:hypothetical protein